MVELDALFSQDRLHTVILGLTVYTKYLDMVSGLIHTGSQPENHLFRTACSKIGQHNGNLDLLHDSDSPSFQFPNHCCCTYIDVITFR